MLAECDFEAEARNITEFTNYLARQELGGVATAPFVFAAFSSTRCPSRPFACTRA